MWSVVRTVFAGWLQQFEGRTPYPYLDRHEPDPILTTGVGNALFDDASAAALPWEIDGRPASRLEIFEDLSEVRAHPELAASGGVAFARLTRIRLSEAAMDRLVASARDEHERVIVRDFFPRFDAWPADAQLATLGMSWAMGPHKFEAFPRFVAAANALDFDAARGEAHISNADPKRNAAHLSLFEDAARVLAESLPRDRFRGGLTPLRPTRPSTPPRGGGILGGVAALLLLGGVAGAVYFASSSIVSRV